MVGTIKVGKLQAADGTSNTISIESGHKLSGAAGSLSIPGSVVQVVQSDTGDQTTTSTSYADTGLTATITPKFSTSKILVSVKGIGSASSADSMQVLFRLVRNQPSSDTIVDGQGTLPYNSSQYGKGFAVVEGQRERYPVMCELLDSPSTTSAITYKMVWLTTAGSGYLGRWGTDGNWNVRTTLTLMEIAQ